MIPDIPLRKIMGRKTARVVNVLAMMAAVTSPVPLMAAFSGGCPDS